MHAQPGCDRLAAGSCLNIGYVAGSVPILFLTKKREYRGTLKTIIVRSFYETVTLYFKLCIITTLFQRSKPPSKSRPVGRRATLAVAFFIPLQILLSRTLDSLYPHPSNSYAFLLPDDH